MGPQGAQGAAARARMAEGLGKLLALSASLLACKPQLLGETGIYRLDTLQPIGAAGGPAPGHWVFVMRQAQLPRQQVGRRGVGAVGWGP